MALDRLGHVEQEPADDGEFLIRVALHRCGEIPLQRAEVLGSRRHRGVRHLEHHPAPVVGVPRPADVPDPLLSERAFLVGFGVLLDTFVVRSLLVPAAVALIGDRIWWPGTLSRRVPEPDREPPAVVRSAW